MTSRRDARRLAVDVLFQADLTGEDPRGVLEGWRAAGRAVPAFTERLVDGVSEHREELDHTIGALAEGWRVERLAGVDRAILRVACYELLHARDVPVAVAIDEAVRAAKELSTEDSGRFVNGILGKVAGLGERDERPAR
ncbi:MAG TPA: transcription antitermination factor NusB [Actinomycetota bacterium]|nr:transcription antitermination factor NusB [Actinomycetota bacterium]